MRTMVDMAARMRSLGSSPSTKVATLGLAGALAFGLTACPGPRPELAAGGGGSGANAAGGGGSGATGGGGPCQTVDLAGCYAEQSLGIPASGLPLPLDFDGDGDDDLLVAGSGAITAYQTSDATFTGHGTVNVPGLALGSIRHAITGRFVGADASVDALVLLDNDDIYVVDGAAVNAQTAAGQFVTTVANARYLVRARLDPDATDDLAVLACANATCVGTGQVRTFRLNGAGTPVEYAGSPFATDQALLRGVAGDVDGDGDDDVIGLEPAAGMVWVMLGSGNGALAAPIATDIGGVLSDVAAADFMTGGGFPDGAEEVVVTRLGTVGAVVLRWDSSQFQSPSSPLDTGGFATAPYLADLNGDGHRDLVYWSAGGVRFHPWDAAQPTSFGGATTLAGNVDTPSPGIVLAELNNDGVADIIFRSSGGETRMLVSQP